MKNLTILLLLWTTTGALAETFESPHGYSFEVPAGWEPLPPEVVAAQFPSSREMQAEGAYFSEEHGAYVAAFWAPGRDMARDTARLVELAARNGNAVASEFERIVKGDPFQGGRVRSHDPMRWVVTLTAGASLEEDERVFLGVRAMKDGAVVLILYMDAEDEALLAPTFDRIVARLTLKRGREYVPSPIPLKLLGLWGVPLFLLTGLVVAHERRKRAVVGV